MVRTPTAALLLLALASTACGSATPSTAVPPISPSAAVEPLQVAAAFYPPEFLARAVGGDGVEVEHLTTTGRTRSR